MFAHPLRMVPGCPIKPTTKLHIASFRDFIKVANQSKKGYPRSLFLESKQVMQLTAELKEDLDLSF